MILCSLVGKNGKSTDLFRMNVAFLNTQKWKDCSATIYSAVTAEAGEVAYQLHSNDGRGQAALPYGVIALCYGYMPPNSSNPRDIPNEHLELIYSAEIQESLARLMLNFASVLFGPRQHTENVYYVYVGVAGPRKSSEKDLQYEKTLVKFERPLMKTFQAANYELIHCAEGIIDDENTYIAVYSDNQINTGDRHDK